MNDILFQRAAYCRIMIGKTLSMCICMRELLLYHLFLVTRIIYDVYCFLNKCGKRVLSSLNCLMMCLQAPSVGKPCPSSTRCAVFQPSSSAFLQLSPESSSMVSDENRYVP